jgi:hypothetical protein
MFGLQNSSRTFRQWFFKRERWIDEPIDGSQVVYSLPSRWDHVKDWAGAFAGLAVGVLVFLALPRLIVALVVGVRAFCHALFH